MLEPNGIEHLHQVIESRRFRFLAPTRQISQDIRYDIRYTSRAVRFALSMVLPSCHSSNSTVCYYYRHVMSGCQFYRSRMKHAIIFYFQITGAWGIWGGGGHDISFDLGPSSIIPVGIYLVYYILQVYIYTQLSPIGEQSTPLLDYRLLHAIRTNCIYFFTNIMYTVNML